MKTYLVLFVCIALSWAEEALKESERKNQEKRGLDEDYGGRSGHGGHQGAVSYSHVVQTHQNQVLHHQPLKTLTITKEVPYPVAIEKHVPIPVKVPVPVAVDRPYPVHVPKPYPVQVIKPVPYYVEKPVPVPVKVPFKVEQQEYILTKVPLVYHATYQDQGLNQGYNQGFNQGYNQGFNQGGYSDYNGGHQQYQQAYPAQVVYDRNYDEQHH